MQWQFIIEEFGPEIEYIKGPKNIVANVLTHLNILPPDNSSNLADCYGLDKDDFPGNAIPITSQLINCKQ